MQQHLFNAEPLPMIEEETAQYKALNLGFAQLTTIDLLSLIIQGAGNKTIEAVRALFHKAQNNLIELGKLSISDISKIDGIGKSKAMSIAAAIELGRRRQYSYALEKPIVQSSADIAKYLQGRFSDLNHEVFAVIFLNRANKINHFQVVSQGGMTGTVADPRIILKLALEHKAVSVVLCHNHPSGSLMPSRADEQLTVKIKEAAKFLDMTVLDHIIVSDAGYYSFADEGLL